MVVLPRRRWVGRRWIRCSNRYIIGVPDRAVVPGQRPRRPRSTGQRDRGQEAKKEKEVLREMLLDAARCPDLLLLRRLAMAQRYGTA